MANVSSFVLDDDVVVILKEIPWGKRSKIINDALRRTYLDAKPEPDPLTRPLQQEAGGEAAQASRQKPKASPATASASKEPLKPEEKPLSETESTTKRTFQILLEKPRTMKSILEQALR